ncbi:MAG: LytTR family DNA-binding domain-containing protein [Saprospiraceae bacterium]|nr:LytTR family DNA-binding domain-containing protein [Saprospiraceae bacterium]
MKPIRCLLVDDEPPAIELLERYVRMIDQLEVVGTSHSAVKAFDMVREQPIDLIFLDIRMPVLNGIDFIKTLKNPPSIILTTAYREYAIDGYDLDIIDYLLKPIAFDRFLKAVDRYRDRTATKVIEKAPDLEESNEFILCNVNRTKHKVWLKDILYIESLKDYVRFHTTKSRLVVKGNLGSFMKQLPTAQFVRIHRSYAVALAYVSAHNQSEVLVEGIRLPIGKSYRDGLLRLISI